MRLFLLLSLACTKDDPVVQDTSPAVVDQDGDGFDSAIDCDDNDPAVNPGAEEIPYDGVDQDCDSFTPDDDLDADGYLLADDCDDTNLYVNPGRDEVVYNGLDDDCDAATLDDDLDQDGFNKDEDCADQDAEIYPGAEEVCDGVDNDCDGQLDNGSVDTQSYWKDSDEDGYGASGNKVEACVAPPGYVANGDDCDDFYPDVNPGETEVCDLVDNDCDGTVDGESAVDRLSWYVDADGDGYGDPGTEVLSCDSVTGYVTDDQDCDDSDAFYNPDTIWWLDYDGDGYGDAAYVDYACEAAPGYIQDNTDCVDYDANVYPGAPETCDGQDNDCDSTTVEDGTVAFLGDNTGVLTDLTATWGAGVDKSPASLTTTEDGTLYVCGGTWFATISTSYNLEIIGEGSETTVLDAGKRGSNLHVKRDGLTVSIEGVTMQRGKARKGGALRCDSASIVSGVDVVLSQGIAIKQGGLVYISDECEVTLEDFVLEDGWAWEDGGAVYLTSGALSLFNGTVEYNIADDDGGAFNVVGFSDSYDTADSRVLDMEDVLVQYNSANRGGGLWFNGGTTVTCSASSGGMSAGFLANDADQRGGGVRVSTQGSEHSFTSDMCDFGEADSGSDNDPSDIEIGAVSYAYGDDASFTCDESSCY